MQRSAIIGQRIRELEALEVPTTREPDFSPFWDETVERVSQHAPEVQTRSVDYPLNGVDVRDATFAGLDGTRVRAWILLPSEARRHPVPAVVWYHGGNGSRQRPFSHAHWIAAGFAVVAMDFRQQGGQTGSHTSLTRCGADSFIVMNLLDHRSYYLFHAWTDALVCLRVAMTTAGIDPARVVVNGASQGGGTALVMAALDPRVAGCLADVPSFAWWDRRIITRTASGGALADYLRRYPQQWDEVYRTLSYYDVMNFTDRIRCPVLASCALADEAVPPECVYAAWNRIASEKTLRVYPTGRHTVEPWQVEEQLAWLRSRLIGA